MKIELDTDLKTITVLEPVTLVDLLELLDQIDDDDAAANQYRIVPENWRQPNPVGSITTTPHPPLTWATPPAPLLVTDAPFAGGATTTTETAIFHNKMGTITETN